MRSLIAALIVTLTAFVAAAADSGPYPSIFLAIQNGDLDAVKHFVDEEPGLIHETDQNAMTPLYLAAYRGKEEIARYLIEKGSDVNYRRVTGETALFAAAQFDHAAIVRLLVEHGADIEAQTGRGRTAIRYAISGGAREVADYLLGVGAALPADGSLLHTAASKGMGAIVAAMIDMGVEPADDDGEGGTFLHSAAAGGLVELAATAIAGGLDVNARNRYGSAPLHKAAAGGHEDLILLLVDSGAEIDLRLPDGRTPCHVALENGHETAAQTLVDRGAAGGLVRFMDVGEDIYLGQEEPAEVPRLFAPGIVSTESWEHGAPAFSPLGVEIYWTPSFQSQRYTRLSGGRWTVPGPSPLRERYGAANPVFSNDGSKLYFHSTSTMAGGDEIRDADLWLVERSGADWSEPRNLGPNVNSDADDRFASLTRDGTLYFTSGYDLYRAEYADGRYAARRRLPDGVNTDDIEMSPCISPDESFLVFESNRPGGFSEMELYVTFREQDGSWSSPKNMGSSINTGGSRFPGLSPDGKFLFFTSTRNGNSDVYWVDARILEPIRGIEYDDIYAAMHRTIVGDGAAAAIDLYRSLKREHSGYYDFGESMLNRLGYQLLAEERYNDAIAVFELNVEAYPESWNVYDSIAEAFMKNGDSEKATRDYNRSLELNSANDNARNMLEKIERKSVNVVSGGGLTLRRSPQLFYPRCTNDASLGDLDGDGDLDLVCSNMARNFSRVWMNDGGGRFTQTDQELTMQGHGVELADLDADGDLDAFVACAGFSDGRQEYSERSKVYLNDGRGRFVDSAQDLGDLELSGTGVTLADVDGDGDVDAMVNYFQHDNIIYINDGGARFTKSDESFPGAATIGDLDGDGDPDYFAKVPGVGYRVALNDGTGAFIDYWQMEEPDVQRAGDAGLGDIDGDGDLDVVVANGSFRTEAAPSRLLINDGSGAFTQANVMLPAVRNAGLAFADLNGDGHLDVVATDFELPNQVWLGDGRGGLLDSGIRMSFGEMFRHVCIGDLDGDGDLDVFFANFNVPGRGGPNEIWINVPSEE
jgi:ankyrin repeat protein